MTKSAAELDREIAASFAEAAPAPKPKKVAKDVEATVRAAQLYVGAFQQTPLRAQQRLYDAARRKIAAVARRRGLDDDDAYRQIFDAARRRGCSAPQPGKDV